MKKLQKNKITEAVFAASFLYGGEYMPVIFVPVFGEIEELAYFYVASDKNTVIIDPGAEAEKFKNIVNKDNLNVKAILLTHGHFDHIGAAEELAELYNIPIYAGQRSIEYTSDPKKNLSKYTSKKISFDNVTEKAEGDIIEVSENFSLKIISTPGHTSDGVVYYDAPHKLAFVGDTIFEGSYGRTDFPGGNEKILLKSIKEKILTLPDDTKLFTGHSRPTTVGIEKTRSF